MKVAKSTMKAPSSRHLYPNRARFSQLARRIAILLVWISANVVLAVETDTFDGTVIDAANWEVVESSSSPVVQNDALFLTHDGSPVGAFPHTPGNSSPGVGVASRCKLSGDFDIQADFSEYTPIPSFNFTQFFFAIYQDPLTQMSIKRITASYADGIQSLYTTDGVHGIGTGITPFPGLENGAFRIVRSGGVIRTYYDVGSGWVHHVSTSAAFTDDVVVILTLLRYPGPTGIASVVLDNFIVNSGTSVCPQGPRDFYVDDDGPGDPGPGDVSISDPLEDGSPEHPFDAIQEAGDVAVDGDTVIVLDGTYNGLGNRDVDFGGKTITVRSQNGPEDCIVDCEGSEAEPHRGFHFHNGEASEAVLEGFTITNGYGPVENLGWITSSAGGGIFCRNSSPTIKGCIIEGNSGYRGGGIHLNDNSNALICNNVIRENSVVMGGGGIFSDEGSNPIIRSNIIAGNVAGSVTGIHGSGGGVCLVRSSPEITNNLVIDNRAIRGAGFTVELSSFPNIVNTTFSNNRAETGSSDLDYGGGALYCWEQGSPTLVNCILWNNYPNEYEKHASSYPVFTYCDVSGGVSGTGNINTDPLFRDSAGGDYRLGSGSPCIDSGDSSAVPADITTDLDGNARTGGSTVDMGAYEYFRCWQEQARLVASDGEAGDYFGNSACLNGDYAIFGAVWDDGKGSAYMFKRDDMKPNRWSEQAKLIASDIPLGSYFGYSVWIDEDSAIVGGGGFAYTYKREGVNWIEEQKLVPPDAPGDYSFGASVCISKGYVIVGASLYGGNGAAFVFERNDEETVPWEQVAKLESPGESSFGFGVCINRSHAIVGAYGGGAAYVFMRDDVDPSRWEQQGRLTPADTPNRYGFGYSVALDEDYSIVGSIHDNYRAGSAYIFKREGTTWIEQAKLIPSGEGEKRFGDKVSMSGEYAVVGAPFEDGCGNGSGAAYIYKRDGASWLEIERLTASDCAAEDQFGSAVSIDGGTVVVGSPLDDDYGDDSGSAYVFENICNTSPVADAGADAEHSTGPDGTVDVPLDGCDSYDPDGDEISCAWYLDGEEIATGCDPIVVLECGEYEFELVVNDGQVDSEPNSVTITVLDGTPPVISCPADVTLECPADTSIEGTGSATATDNCDESPVITHGDVTYGDCPQVIERTWTATDAADNSSSCVQIITVQDTTPPVITCPPNVVLECPADTSVAATGSATATDTCGDVTIASSDVWVDGCGNTGTLTRTWTATDDCGNAATCVQTITVVDTTPPVIICPADVTLECPADTSIGATGTAIATDTCGDVAIASSDVWVGGCGNTGVLTRTWTATDECGNAAMCMQIVRVVDTTPPTFTESPTDKTVQRDGNGNIDELNAWLASVVEATDSCGEVTVTEDYTSFPYECGNTGSVIVTWTAADECGNESTATATFTIEDPTAAVTYDGDQLLSTNGSATADTSLTATLRDEAGQLLDIDGEEVTFTLAADGIGTIVFNSSTVNGVATVVQSLEPAIYEVTITLGCLDFTGKAFVVVYNPDGGFATGGGWIVPAADGLNTYPNVRANFGFNAKYKQDNPTGHLEFRYSDGHIDLKSTSIEQLVITGGRIAQFKGWASVNKVDGFWFFVKAIDNGEPGTADTFEIKTWAPGVDPEGDPTERASGQLQGGNIVVHTKAK